MTTPKANETTNETTNERANETAGAAWAEKCLNCGTALSGQFCPNCGQRAIPPYPTVGELASDTFHELSGWDGRFANTFRTLLRRPGQLTLDFLNGRRARYISPIRLYLVCSLAFFIVSAAAPNLRSNGTKTGTVVETGGFKIGVFIPPTPGDSGTMSRGGLTPEERADIQRELESSPPWIRMILLRAIEDPARFQHQLIQAMPRALFALLPVFALIVALFYRGRHYPEHLYFAIHLHAFVFLALLAGELAKFTRMFVIATIVGVAALIWVVVYADFALKRVYGGGSTTTVVKAAGIGTLYALASVPVIFALMAWAALSG